MLNWTQAQLAKAADLSEVAVKNLERGRTDPRASTLTAIQEAVDHAGVVFLDPGDTRNGGSGDEIRAEGREVGAVAGRASVLCLDDGHFEKSVQRVAPNS